MEAVDAVFHELEFRSLSKELPALAAQGSEQAAGEAVASPTPTMFSVAQRGQMALFAEEAARPSQTVDSAYGCVQDEPSLRTLLETVVTAPLLSFDVETTSTDAMQAQLVGLGLAWGKGQARPTCRWPTPIRPRSTGIRCATACRRLLPTPMSQGGAQRQV